MKFSYKELEKYFADSLPSADKVADVLTNHAFEVDEMTAKDDGDFELEIKVLPDRADDAKDPLGMAREISSLLEQPLKDEFISSPDEKTARLKIEFTVDDVNGLVGYSFTESEVIDFLARARVVVKKESEKLLALIPAERVDLNIKEDLADEIARFKGYADLEAKALPSWEGDVPANDYFIISNRLRAFFAGREFTEIYGYTFKPEGAVEVEKPLASDKAFLRTDLADGMENYLKQNLDHIVFDDDPVLLFEIGSGFKALDQEERYLCFGLACKTPKIFNKAENRFQEVLVEIEKEFSADKKSITVKKDDNFVVAEVNLNDLNSLSEKADLSPFLKKDTDYTPFSVYPRIIRDIALFVPESVKAEEVAKMITEEATDLLVYGPVLFDEFKKDGRVSYAFRLVFQSYEKTLTDAEINPIMANIEATLGAEKDFEIRQ